MKFWNEPSLLFRYSLFHLWRCGVSIIASEHFLIIERHFSKLLEYLGTIAEKRLGCRCKLGYVVGLHVVGKDSWKNWHVEKFRINSSKWHFKEWSLKVGVEDLGPKSMTPIVLGKFWRKGERSIEVGNMMLESFLKQLF